MRIEWNEAEKIFLQYEKYDAHLYSIEYDICYLIFLENKQIEIELWETQPEHLTFSQPLSFFIISLRTMTFHDISWLDWVVVVIIVKLVVGGCVR